MATSEAFDGTEWKTLQFTPFWVYQLVAYADGNIDDSESDKIVDELLKAAKCENELAAEVLNAVAKDYFAVAQKYAGDDRAAIDGIKDVAALLKQKAPEDVAGFKDAMMNIGMNVAESSDGTPGGTATDDEEKDVLAKIAAAFEG
jgi:tellurite resistance protein